MANYYVCTIMFILTRLKWMNSTDSFISFVCFLFYLFNSGSMFISKCLYCTSICIFVLCMTATAFINRYSFSRYTLIKMSCPRDKRSAQLQMSLNAGKWHIDRSIWDINADRENSLEERGWREVGCKKIIEISGAVRNTVRRLPCARPSTIYCNIYIILPVKMQPL